MALEHIIKHSCRFNIKNPQHKKVNEVLVNLSPDVCKSKSQFLIDAAEYYIDHFGKEAFMDVKKNKVEYVTREEFEALKEHIIDLAINAAKDEMIRLEELEAAKKEVEKVTDEKPISQKMFKAI